jgi:nicotinamidase-related amidase
MTELTLHLRRFKLGQDSGGHNEWQPEVTRKQVAATATAIIICDMWDKHWSRGASERVDAMVPQMNQVLHIARDKGVQIIHAPSDTMNFYAGTPAHQRILDAPVVEPPPDLVLPVPALPIDHSDDGSDTGEVKTYRAWSRQHPGLDIDQERDAISDNGRQIYSFLHLCGIGQVLIMGVHTNMCVLNRSFAIKQMVKWGVEIVLVRDLTDTMYNPAMPPYVSHSQGTELVIGYIERFWCPSITSEDIISSAA